MDLPRPAREPACFIRNLPDPPAAKKKGQRKSDLVYAAETAKVNKRRIPRSKFVNKDFEIFQV